MTKKNCIYLLGLNMFLVPQVKIGINLSSKLCLKIVPNFRTAWI